MMPGNNSSHKTAVDSSTTYNLPQLVSERARHYQRVQIRAVVIYIYGRTCAIVCICNVGGVKPQPF